jgi:hypothetical protein
MAVYKVPQDVEAEDKLLGPFSFRQFIYLIVALMGLAIAWALANVFIPLAIIPLPIVIFFGALALPLKKDQPMEIYLLAVLSYYLKPRKRIWQADGVQSLIEIVAPKVVEEQLTKDLSETEAERRLSYLANIVDSRGWAVRGVDVPQADNAMQADVFFAAQQTEDILDDGSSVTHTFDSMIDQADAKRRQNARNLLSQPTAAPLVLPTPDPYANLTPPQAQLDPVSGQQVAPVDPQVSFNPYPQSMHQAVVNPIGTTPPTPPQQIPAPATSQPLVSPDIINLANNSDLSIETIAHEAKRIHDKETHSLDGEVVISLR